MTGKRYSIDQLSTATTRQAQGEMAIMQRDLKKLRDSLSNGSWTIKEPAILSSRKKTKKTTRSSPLFGLSIDSIAGLAAGDILGEAGSGFGSAAQKAGRVLALLASGQRIR